MKNNLLAVIILTLALNLSAIAKPLEQNNNVYQNPTIGLSITKPDNWHFTSIQQHKENLKNIKLQDKQFTEAIQKYSSAPLVVMTKHPEPHDDLNPSFKIAIKPFGALPRDSKEIISMTIKPFEIMFKDFKLVEGPKDAEISGLKEAYAKFYYLLEGQNGKQFLTSSELWVIPQGDYFFLIGVGNKQNSSEEVNTEIKEIISSIKVEK